MRLHPLLSALGGQPAFQKLVDALGSGESGTHVLSAISPARAYALAALHAAVRRPMLLVTAD